VPDVSVDLNICSTSTMGGMSDVAATGRPTLAVISASVRKQRVSRLLADWIVDTIPADLAEVDLIDLAEVRFPDDGLLEPGGGGGVRSPMASRIEAASGFVIVTPEYNHSFPASLKRAIDWHYQEWMFKAALLVSFGVHGGLLAAEQLRGVFAELSVVTTRRVVGVRMPWEHLGPDGFEAEPGLERAVQAALSELRWWVDTLDTARRDRPLVH
jgi:NAD(P)H-dependent FMN reductase